MSRLMNNRVDVTLYLFQRRIVYMFVYTCLPLNWRLQMCIKLNIYDDMITNGKPFWIGSKLKFW